MTDLVLVFAKVPGLGIAKSRLARAWGVERAEAIYSELLGCTAEAVKSLHHGIAYTGAEDPGALRDSFPRASSWIPQRGDTLGDRLRNACADAFSGGRECVCAIGCDCPELHESDIHDALKRLRDGNDVVLGPASDGGYYLVACTRAGLVVFSATGWGQASLCAETVDIANAHGLRTSLLDVKSDVDEPSDYLHWKGTLDA